MSDPNLSPLPSDTSDLIYIPRMKLTTEIREMVEISPRGSVDTYGATPLDRIHTLIQQRDAFRRLKSLAEHFPKNVPKKVCEFVRDTFRRRFIGRIEANEENFLTRIVQDYESTLEPELIEMVNRARLGHAAPIELLLVRDVLGIRSIELACLTHPYGEVKSPLYNDMNEALGDMRGAVRYGIETLGGTFHSEPEETRFRIKEAIGDETDQLAADDSPGLLMTRKRNLGTLPDGTIIRERSSFVLRIDPGSRLFQLLNKEDIQELMNIRFLSGKDQEKVLEKFEPIISQLLLEDKQAIPVSSTIYAFNRDTEAVIEQLEKERAPSRRQFFEASVTKLAVNPAEVKDTLTKLDIARAETEENLFSQAKLPLPVHEEMSESERVEAAQRQELLDRISEMYSHPIYQTPRPIATEDQE